jgi:hypothetical protein
MSDKITVPIEGKPLIHKARKIPWKNTTLTIQKNGYSEVYGYGRRIIHCDTSCRRNSGLHRLHPGGNRGGLIVPIVSKYSSWAWRKAARPYSEYMRRLIQQASIALGSSGSVIEPEPFEPDDDYDSIVSPLVSKTSTKPRDCQDEVYCILEASGLFGPETMDYLVYVALDSRWKIKRFRLW